MKINDTGNSGSKNRGTFFRKRVLPRYEEAGFPRASGIDGKKQLGERNEPIGISVKI